MSEYPLYDSIQTAKVTLSMKGGKLNATPSKAVTPALAEFIRAHKTVLVAMIERGRDLAPCEHCQGAQIAVRTFDDYENAECERKGRPVPTDTGFGLQLKRHRPEIECAKRTYCGKVQWCYVGLGWRSEGSQSSQGLPSELGSQGSQSSQGLPNLYLPTNRRPQDESYSVAINRENPGNPDYPDYPNCDIPRENEESHSLDDINALLNTENDEVLF